MPKKNQIIVACTANICRSPMGEELLRHALAAESGALKKLRIISAGVTAYDGDPPSPNAVRALAKVNLDISKHRSKSIKGEMLDQALAVFCMTSQHSRLIRMNHPGHTVPVHLFREFMDTADTLEIPDPFGQNLPAYEACRDSMVEAIPSIVNYLKEHLSAAK